MEILEAINMTNGLFGNLLLTTPVKRKMFVSYHHDNDQWYYNEFSRTFDLGFEAIQDRSLDRLIDSNNTDYVIGRIRQNYITGTSCTFVLCGPQTRWRKYVDWEIKGTLDREHGLIGIKLPNNPADLHGGVHKPDRLQDNIDSGYAVWINWEDLAGGPEYLRRIIEIANLKSSQLIVNSRKIRKRSG